MEDYYNDFRKQVLKNRLEYGKADLKSVIGWILYEHPELKVKVKEIIPIVSKIVENVNSMDIGEVEKEFYQYDYQRYLREEKRFKLPDDPQYIVLRFAPEPSGYMHIGHAKSLMLNILYLERYRGELIIRFDDTNPEKCSKEYEQAMLEDIEWLGAKYSKITHSSSYMDILYEYAEKLISLDKMYLTNSSQEQISEMRKTGIPIKDRNNSIEENLDMFRSAINGEYKEGEVVALYKGDLSSHNTTMRDPVMFRVVEHPHYIHGNKYKFWPTYDFATPILDSIELITHALRSKEYELRTELYHSILRDLGLRDIVLIHFSRLEIKGTSTSKRKIRELVEKNIVDGWDDPRLATIKALRRRGILKDAIKEFVSRFGPGKQETIVEWKMLLDINREIMEKKLRRIDKITFFKDPIPINLKLLKQKDGKNIYWEGTIYVDKRELADVLNLKGIGVVKKVGDVYYYGQANDLPVVDWAKKPVKINVIIPKELLLADEEVNPESLDIIEGYIDEEHLSKERLFLIGIGYVIKDKDKYIFTC